MLRKILMSAGAFALLALPAAGQNYGAQTYSAQPAAMPAAASDGMTPPPGYQGQWFTSADRCDYSRAGRPGEEVWYLIINTAHRKCRTRIVVRAFADYRY
ncbi:MAG: hypothetical protein ACSHWZ_16490 [Sulfitobacter sp.]